MVQSVGRKESPRSLANLRMGQAIGAGDGFVQQYALGANTTQIGRRIFDAANPLRLAGRAFSAAAGNRRRNKDRWTPPPPGVLTWT